MNKKNLCYLFYIVFILICCIPTLVFAANNEKGKLNYGDFDMECTYENGVTLTFYYDNNAYGIESSNIRLSNAIRPPLESEFIYFYNEAVWSKEVLSKVTCPNTIYYSVIEQTDASGNKVAFQALYRQADIGWAFWDFDNYDSDTINTGQIITGFKATSGKWISIHTPDGSILASRRHNGVTNKPDESASLKFYLKAERIYLNKEVDTITYSYKSVAVTDQAATKPSYMRIMKYDSPEGSEIFLAEKDQTITVLNPRATTWQIYDADASFETQFTCFHASTKNIETNRGDTSYSFSQARHSTVKSFKYKKADVKPITLIEMQNNSECTGVLYQQISSETYSDSETTNTSICELIPETALILVKIMNWIRILVPAFLIILTGVDITKIVIAGNLEEELPKRRKSIIIRFIVVLAFFFLPLLVQVIFSIASTASGTDYGDINCLWK